MDREEEGVPGRARTWTIPNRSGEAPELVKVKG